MDMLVPIIVVSILQFFMTNQSGGTGGIEYASQCRRHKRQQFNPWVGKVPWRRKRHSFQYSYLKNSMGRGALWATGHEVAESDTTEVTWYAITNDVSIFYANHF